MPYIKEERRAQAAVYPETKGELNFAITRFMVEYVKRSGKSYDVISDAIGAANDAAAEMRRRLLNPYEDFKIQENGDVY